ncbi:acyl-CoA dehydrogenase [Ramlibacter henchirensis]|uniref:Acyl-CoA dehydrogenase n=1 Tax=Ramlibacter henchirensis TaxID=204072 RepID=A0A4Z0BXP1_9BURK|nr:acyl-CoA dehydrogenase family protein [Ramlibacter henchirensis]TFZ02699.1 acyl-CoA dehydrogenase [Ramlibacter henchirensis]
MNTTHDTAHVSLDLGEDYPEIRESVRRICSDFPGAYWRDLDEREAYPAEFVKAMTEAGYLASLIPEEYGGAGLPLRAAGVVLEEIHASGGNAGATHAQMYTMGTVLRHGSAAQKERYLPKIASGELRLQAFGVTEPTSGTDTTKLKTRAERQGDHYVINGQKIWTSRALYSDLMLLLARTTPLEQVTKRTDGLSVFLVDMRQAVGNGMTIRPIKAMINHNTTEVFFDNLRIPADSLIGEEGKGLRCILDGMNAERILVSHESLGDAKWFTRTAVRYANDRVVFDRPIGKNQGIQFPIAKAYAQTQAAELMLRKAAAMFEAGQPCGEYANLSKLLTAEAAWEAGEACMQTHGGFAYAREYDIERKWREARVQRTAPISTNLILSYIAEHVLGLPRSY